MKRALQSLRQRGRRYYHRERSLSGNINNNDIIARHVIPSSIFSVLKEERSELMKSPIIVILSSSNNEDGRKPNEQLQQLQRKLEYYGTSALGLAMIPYKVQGSYPTWEDIQKIQFLKQRSGATTIMGVGSGVAIDTAKLVVSCGTSNDDDYHYLFPGTDAALMASYTNFCMVYNTQEQTILTIPTTASPSSSLGFIVLDPEESIVPHSHTSYACQSVLQIEGGVSAKKRLDSLLLEQQQQRQQQSSKDNTITTINNMNWVEQTAPYVMTMENNENQNSGSKMKQQQHHYYYKRSIPLSLSSALIPTAFASTHIFTFWASLLQNNNDDHSSSTTAPPSLASLALEPRSISNLMKCIEENQISTLNDTTLKERKIIIDDNPNQDIESILVNSLNR